MRQERTVQATIFEVFAQHDIGCELKAMSKWLDGQRRLISLVAGDLRRQGVRETGRRGLPAESVLRCALLKQQRQLSYEELASIWRIPPRSVPLPACRWRGRRRSRCCTTRSRRFAPKPGRRSTRRCWPAPSKTSWRAVPWYGSTLASGRRPSPRTRHDAGPCGRLRNHSGSAADAAPGHIHDLHAAGRVHELHPTVKALDLTDEERDALIRFLRDAIDPDRFPLSPVFASSLLVDQIRPVSMVSH